MKNTVPMSEGHIVKLVRTEIVTQAESGIRRGTGDDRERTNGRMTEAYRQNKAESYVTQGNRCTMVKCGKKSE